MRATKLIDHLTKYYEDEYSQAVTAVKSKYFKPSEVVRNAIDRCLGVALFVQYLGMDYEDSNREYEIVKEKLEKLLDNNVKA